MPANLRTVAALVFLALAFFALDAHAELDNRDLLDGILRRYTDAASTWADVITAAATWLFWTLAVISMVWTFGMLALRKADIGEFFAEFLRFIMFTGFFWWLLMNGPNFAISIMDSMRQLGGNATGLGTALSPSNIVDVGFGIFGKVVDQSSLWSPVDSAVGIVIAAIILVILALVAVNMLILLICGWLLAYAGVFFLGFGGSSWTSDMAISYFKTVLNIAAQLLGMVLIVGIANTFLSDYYTLMQAGPVLIKDLGVMLIIAVILLSIMNKVPTMLGGLASGGGAHALGSGMGSSSVGGAVGTAGAMVATAGAAVATAGAAIAAGAVGAAGGASAIMAAVSQGSQNVSAGSDLVSRIGGGMAEGSGGGSGLGTGGGASGPGRSLAEQMGAGMMGVAPAAASGGGQRSQDSGQAGGGAQASAGQGSKPSGGSNGGVAKGGAGTAKGDAGQGVEGGRSSGQGGGAAGAKVAGGFSPPKGTGGMFGTAAKIAVDAGANLAVGTWDVGAAKVGEVVDAAKERVGQSLGGQVATAIRTRGAAGEAPPAFDGDSLGASANNDTAVDAAAEVAAFRDRRTS
jgi:type IV secretion system protein VirB6/type IV secretion system protein TrbL